MINRKPQCVTSKGFAQAKSDKYIFHQYYRGVRKRICLFHIMDSFLNIENAYTMPMGIFAKDTIRYGYHLLFLDVARHTSQKPASSDTSST
jgi:hypothetical protein